MRSVRGRHTGNHGVSSTSSRNIFQPIPGTGLFDVHMGISGNGGTPKSSSLVGLFLINHPFFGYRHLWKPPYVIYCWKKQLGPQYSQMILPPPKKKNEDHASSTCFFLTLRSSVASQSPLTSGQVVLDLVRSLVNGLVYGVHLNHMYVFFHYHFWEPGSGGSFRKTSSQWTSLV